MKTGPKPLPRTQCTVDGCERIADHPTKGICHKHYARIRRRGSSMPTRRERGSGTLTTFGYISIAVNGKKKQEHVLIAEKAIGRALPLGAEVHHVNGDRSDNRNCNLVICPSRAFHKLLHVRADALDACGNPNHRKCPFCKKYDDPGKMKHNKSSRYYFHAACSAAYKKERYGNVK